MEYRLPIHQGWKYITLYYIIQLSLYSTATHFFSAILLFFNSSAVLLLEAAEVLRFTLALFLYSPTLLSRLSAAQLASILSFCLTVALFRTPLCHDSTATSFATPMFNFCRSSPVHTSRIHYSSISLLPKLRNSITFKTQKSASPLAHDSTLLLR